MNETDSILRICRIKRYEKDYLTSLFPHNMIPILFCLDWNNIHELFMSIARCVGRIHSIVFYSILT